MSAPRQNISSGSPWEDEIAYSRGVVIDDWILLSGCTGTNPQTGKISEDIIEQTEQAFDNIIKALGQAGSSLGDVIRVQYILTDKADFPKIYPVLRKYFGNVKPAATMIQAQLMKDEMKIEIEVTAKKGGSCIPTNWLSISPNL